jgi:inosose dehydratase
VSASRLVPPAHSTTLLRGHRHSMQHRSTPSIRVATAPVSWGVMEETDTSVWPAASQVIEEIATAGYEGTELGPFAYYPSDALSLHSTLERHHLTLTSAFVPLRWFQPERLPGDLESLMTVAQLLAALGCPYVVVADGMAAAGEEAPSESAWRGAAAAMERAARQLRPLGLELVFHLEAGSHLATPEDEARLCLLTDPDLVGICLDTGHYAYSFGNPRDAVRRYGRRIRYVHLKDVDPVVRERVAQQHLDFYTAVRVGIFTPLGQGCADIAGVVGDLLSLNYQGWIVAEQDVLLPVSQAASPLENARLSRDFLRQLGI